LRSSKKNLAGEAKENLSDSEKYPLKAKVTNTRKTKILQNGQQNQIPEKVINIYLSFKIEGLTKLIKSRLENVSSRLKDSKTSIKLCYPKDFNPHTPTIIIAAAAERLVPDSIIEALKNEKGEKKYEMIVLNCIKNPVVQSNTFSIDVEGKEVFFHPTVLEYINNNGMFAWPERKDIDAILCDVILSYVSL